MHFAVRAVPPDEFARWLATARTRDRLWTGRLHRAVPAEPERAPLHLSDGRAGPVRRHRNPANPARTGSARTAVSRFAAYGAVMLASSPGARSHGTSQFRWSPARWSFSVVIAVLAWVMLKGHLPYLWREWITSVDHKRIGVMYVLLGLVMLLRGFIDAIMMRIAAGAGVSRGGLPPARALQPDLLGARHHHDLLRGNAADDRSDELRGAAAAGGARRRIPDLELDELLAHRNRRTAGQSFADHR